MDKLRAMTYFSSVVRAGGFAAAARTLMVSPPAVTQLVAALEKSLGVQLLERTSRKVNLTPDGVRYLALCEEVLEQVEATETELSASRITGSLIVGASRVVLTHCIAPMLTAFLSRHPDLRLDLRVVNTSTETLADSVDVQVLFGWVERSDIVAQCVAQSNFVTCAAPSYWQARGRPSHPDQLREHDCLTYRLPRGVLLNNWKYRRGAELSEVQIQSRLISDDRDTLGVAAAMGAGVVRITDLTMRRYLKDGLLEPVLTDWEALEAPPVWLVYRKSLRNTARVKAFSVFVKDALARMEKSLIGVPSPTPHYYRQPWDARPRGRN